MTIHLHAETLHFCADLARAAAAGIPAERSHYTAAAQALLVLAEEIEGIAAPESREPKCAA